LASEYGTLGAPNDRKLTTAQTIASKRMLCFICASRHSAQPQNTGSGRLPVKRVKQTTSKAAVDSSSDDLTKLATDQCPFIIQMRNKKAPAFCFGGRDTGASWHC
jgi:hypothetical protein